MKLTINKEYFRNHLFVAILMGALGLWFGYDGIVKYPSMSGAALYESIEKSAAPEGTNLEAFKAQKIQTQYGFMFFALMTSLIVGSRLYKSKKFQFAFDDDGFNYFEKHFSYDQIVAIDDSRWEKKTITRIIATNDSQSEKKDNTLIATNSCSIVLDGWHHNGVKEFHEKALAKMPKKEES